MAVSVDARSSQLDKVVVDPGLVQEDLAANLIGAVGSRVRRARRLARKFDWSFAFGPWGRPA
jgi:hypothetical protein